jgi:integrase
MDPRARSLRARIAELEQQIKTQREASQQAALREAEEEVAAARDAARRIREQMAADRQEVGQFTARFNEYRSLQEELTQLEKAHRDAVERRAKLEATERGRTPAVRTLEAATIPREAWRPLYLRDAGLSIAAALLAALAAVWLVELFNRPEPQPPVVIAQPVVPGVLVHGGPRPVALPGQRHAVLEAPDRALLPPPPALPRELDGGEVEKLVAAGDDDARIAMLLLLHGVAPEEMVGLRRGDIDVARRAIRVGGEWPREIPIGGALERALAAKAADADAPLAPLRGGRPATPADLAGAILYAAHDAGIARPSEATPAALRHTYIAFLVRQGIRFADLARVVGHLPPEALAAYGDLAPAGPRAALDAIELVLPPLRGPAGRG